MINKCFYFQPLLSDKLFTSFRYASAFCYSRFFFFFAGSVYQRSHLYCAFLEFFFFFIVVVKQFYSCLLLFQIVKPHWSMNFYCGGIFLSALQKLGLFCADHSNTILIRNIEIRGFHET